MRVQIRDARRLFVRARPRHLVATHEAIEERIGEPNARDPRAAVVQQLGLLVQI